MVCVPFVVGVKMPNACHQQPNPRHNDGQRAAPEHRTIMREAYVETAVRGFGLLHGFVSAIPHRTPAYCGCSTRCYDIF